MSDKLIETYSGSVVCPGEGCGFHFDMYFARSEEEGSEILMAVVRTHGRFAHGSSTAFNPEVRLVEAGGIHKLAQGRPERQN